MKSNSKSKRIKWIIIIECIALIFLIIGLVIGVRNTKISKKEDKQNLEENIVKDKPDELYIVDISENEVNIVDESEEPSKNIDNSSDKTKGNTPYYIKVNYGAQVVTIYSKDENGYYTVPTKAMVCSTGAYTPRSGVYSIPGRWEWGLLQGNVYGQYVTKITGNILFHSVPYTKRDASSLEYWEYDKLGTAASLGCVRLKVEDAKWIYNNCANGTKVEFYSSDNPGPLGKPTSKKISSYPDYLRNWDPTDPNYNNPWHNYKEENNDKNKTKNEVANETNDNTKNEVKNETNDNTKNEVTNETKDKTKNEITNETKDNAKNEVKNEINNQAKNEVNNKIENKVQNKLENKVTNKK